MKIETAADLLTWKNAQLEENTLLEFTQQYEKLTDEQKSELIDRDKSIHKQTQNCICHNGHSVTLSFYTKMSIIFTAISF